MPQSNDDEGWVTLRVAHEHTGASISAIRQWYKKGEIDSKERKSRYGPEKLVRLDQVTARVQSYQPHPTVPDPSDQAAYADAIHLPSLADALRMLAKAAEEIEILKMENQTMMSVIAQLSGSNYAASQLVEAAKP